ncbi:MAG: hypothetical protein HY741_28550 [Chloroflexi bacterium]|nr:hypothetical protein [Chloroflexota bacterium]
MVAQLEWARTSRRPYADTTNQFGIRFSLDALLAQVELALLEPEYAHALTLSTALTEYLAHNQMRHYQPAALLLHARALMNAAQLDRAAQTLHAARELAEQMKAYWRLWQVLAALGELETARGDSAAADASRAQARAWIEYIAARTPTELRAVFLQTPRVRAVLETG